MQPLVQLTRIIGDHRQTEAHEYHCAFQTVYLSTLLHFRKTLQDLRLGS